MGAFTDSNAPHRLQIQWPMLEYFSCTVVGLQCASADETTTEESMVELILSLSVCSDSPIFDFPDHDGIKS